MYIKKNHRKKKCRPYAGNDALISVACTIQNHEWMNGSMNYLTEATARKNLNMIISARAAKKDMHIICSTET